MEVSINIINAYEALGRLICCFDEGSQDAEDMLNLISDVTKVPEEERGCYLADRIANEDRDVEEIPPEAAEILDLDINERWFKWPEW